MPDRTGWSGFGAWATSCAASDLDLLLVRPTPLRFLDRAADLYEKLDVPVGLDLIVYTPEEFERLKVESPFVRHIVETGEVVYEAGSDV